MKPETVKDLLAGGHIVLGEVRNIAKSIFDGEMTAAGPEGYIITAANFDALPDSCQQFIIKAVLEFKVTNVLDAAESTETEDAMTSIQRLGQEFDSEGEDPFSPKIPSPNDGELS